MQNIINGKVFVLGNNIDTDQIIPAEHLVYSLADPRESKMYGRFALSGIPISNCGLPGGNIPFVKEGMFKSVYDIIVAGKNFGCGSSREHAPYALQKAGVKVVVAVSYARIFYRNSVAGAFIIPFESEKNLCQIVNTDDVLQINPDQNNIYNKTKDETYKLKSLGGVAPIIKAGGIFKYAKLNGMV